MSLPRLSGTALSVVGWATGWGPLRSGVRALAREALGVAHLGALPEHLRVPLPVDPRPLSLRPAPRRWAANSLALPTHGRRALRTVDELHAAFRRGELLPREVAARARAELVRRAQAIHGRVDLCAALVPEDEQEAAAREADASLRVGLARALDGVPVLIKDVLDMRGLPTRMGAPFVVAAAAADATAVARLRASGAVLLGKATMTELGISPLGASGHQRLPYNPHAPGRAAGGSSTGSAVAVALGIVPLSSGSDAGGSVRVPASLCGIFGLKPTFGRVSRVGEALGGSVNHVGALGVCARDLARFLDAVASTSDPEDAHTGWVAPAPAEGFGARLGDGVRGLRIGVDEADWLDVEPAIARACRDALAALERDGATLVPVHVPLARHATALGVATVGAEGAALSRALAPGLAAQLSEDVRLAMRVGGDLSAGEYLDLQRLRGGLARQLAQVLTQVDVLASATVATGAPRLLPQATDGGAADGDMVAALCRQTFMANLTGVPAGTVPVGVDGDGVPIGLQLVGDAGDEAGVLAVMAHLERLGFTARCAPGALDLLG
jgi:aspartyl-tRNA(Asn)/glutamyl-tRNA(Gln) amidotransferase subunit A